MGVERKNSMRKNDKGFSLIELLVAMAIMAIISVALVGFIKAGSTNYRKTNQNVKVQYEQQLVVNQLRDLILEASAGVYYDASSQTLAIYSRSTDAAGVTTYPVTRISYNATAQEMKFGKATFATVSAIDFTTISADKLLAENVTQFNVDLTDVAKGKIKFQLGFQIEQTTSTVTETVALRNNLLVSNEIDTIFAGTDTIRDSFIEKITIFRGEQAFVPAGTDTIGKLNQPVSVQYSAVVEASSTSTREYAVQWRLEDNPVGVTLTDSMVTIDSSVMDGEEFKLYATSIDDPTKFAFITITVEDGGLYPVSAELEGPFDVQDGNGYRVYRFVPTLEYTDGTRTSDASLFSWSFVDALPVGSSFDLETGVLKLTHNANGRQFLIYGKAWEPDFNGEAVLTNTITLDVNDIPEYDSGEPEVKLAVSGDLKRGGYIFPTLSFKNVTHSNFSYEWYIEPYKDADSFEWFMDLEGKKPSGVNSFNMVTLSENPLTNYKGEGSKRKLTTGASVRSVSLCCSKSLDWQHTYKVKIWAKAIDNKTKEELVAEPQIVTLSPVKLKITPSEEFWDDTIPFSDTITCEKQYDGQIRVFKMDCEGLYVTGVAGLTSGDRNIESQRRYVFYDENNVLINRTDDLPAAEEQQGAMVYGFKAFPMKWMEDHLADDKVPLPYKMSYAVHFVDKDYSELNYATSNYYTFDINYDDYVPNN